MRERGMREIEGDEKERERERGREIQLRIF